MIENQAGSRPDRGCMDQTTQLFLERRRTFRRTTICHS